MASGNRRLGTATLGLALSVAVPNVVGHPLRKGAPGKMDFVIETTAHVDFSALFDQVSREGWSKDNWDDEPSQSQAYLGSDEGISQNRCQRQPQQYYVTVTLPCLPQDSAPKPTTLYPEPGCDTCFGTVIQCEQNPNHYATVTTGGKGPYPSVSTRLPECETCTGTVYTYNPRQPQGGYRVPPAVTVKLDGAHPAGPRVTLSPVLPLDAPTVVCGTPGFDQHFPTYYADGADQESVTRTVMPHDRSAEPVVIIGVPHSKNGNMPDLWPCTDCGHHQRYTHHSEMTLPPLQPGYPPIIVKVNAGNNNGNNHIEAGNGVGDGIQAGVHAGNGVSSDSNSDGGSSRGKIYGGDSSGRDGNTGWNKYASTSGGGKSTSDGWDSNGGSIPFPPPPPPPHNGTHNPQPGHAPSGRSPP